MDITKEIDNAKTESFILIRFEKLGAGSPQIYFNQVNAFQIMGSSAALEVYGKNMFIRETAEAAQKEQEQQIAVAKPEVLIPRGK